MKYGMALMPQETELEYIPKVLSNMPGWRDIESEYRYQTFLVSAIRERRGKSSLKVRATLMHALPSN